MKMPDNVRGSVKVLPKTLLQGSPIKHKGRSSSIEEMVRFQALSPKKKVDTSNILQKNSQPFPGKFVSPLQS